MEEFVLLLLLGCCVGGANGQIGVTNCYPADDLCGVYLTNAECEAATTTCICKTGYVEVIPANGGPSVACTYECGALAAPANGAVDTTDGTTTDDVATFNCDSTYKLSGASESTCVADTGWDNTATTCVPVEIGDSCATNIFACNSIANAQCETFTSCECLAGYEDDGTGLACSEIDECAPAPCQNGATCVDALGSYSCTCVAGYTDTNCQTDIDECAGDPCQNGGTCTDGVNMYTCSCVAGYNGDDCENNINECSPDPCQNGATCLDGINTYSCSCVAGYTDTNCQTNINECDPDPCQNGATCVDGVNQYTCNCVAGYNGNECQTNIDECGPDSCQNSGTCVDGVNQYTCNCVTGYNGNNCQNNIDECASHACQNGADCVDGINTYTCVCPSGYTGQFCNENIDECASHACQNGADCVDGINRYTCVCPAGYTGQFCNDEQSIEGYNLSTGLIIIGVVLGFTNLVVLACVGYATLLIRRIKAKPDGLEFNTPIRNDRKSQTYQNETFQVSAADDGASSNEASGRVSHTEYSGLDVNTRDEQTPYDIVK